MGLVAEASRASSSLARWDCACGWGQNLANFGRLEEYLDYEYLRYLLESRSAIAMIGYGWMCEEKLYAIWLYIIHFLSSAANCKRKEGQQSHQRLCQRLQASFFQFQPFSFRPKALRPAFGQLAPHISIKSHTSYNNLYNSNLIRIS